MHRIHTTSFVSFKILTLFWVLCGMAVPLTGVASETGTSLKEDARKAGRATGSAVREVGQGLKQAGKEIGSAAKEGGREFRRAVKGSK